LFEVVTSYIYQISSEHVLEASGISVAPPHRLQTASNIPPPLSVLSTCSRCVEPTTLSKATASDGIDSSSSDEEENGDEEKDRDEEEESKDDDEDGRESKDEDGGNGGGDDEREVTPITPNRGEFFLLYCDIIH
jgi:hypothetical protein